MYRTLWAAFAALGFAITSGCAICESCFDYTYPAYGGKYCWDADDCCRAGSAFCHVVDGGARVDPHQIDEIPDPVPDPPAYVPDPEPTQQTPVPPPVPEVEPPTDLTPPVAPTLPPGEIPDTGLPPIESLDIPPLGDLDSPDAP